LKLQVNHSAKSLASTATKSIILIAIASFREKGRKEIDTRLCGEYLSKFRGINGVRQR